MPPAAMNLRQANRICNAMFSGSKLRQGKDTSR
jgi:hypothetical protein